MTYQVVVVIDDDLSVRKALERLIRSTGIEVRAFGSAEEFLDANQPLPGCMVVDVRLPGMSGLELQEHLVATGRHVPLVMISAHDDDREYNSAIAAGAVTLLHKPFEQESLFEVLAKALDCSVRALSGK